MQTSTSIYIYICIDLLPPSTRISLSHLDDDDDPASATAVDAGLVFKGQIGQTMARLRRIAKELSAELTSLPFWSRTQHPKVKQTKQRGTRRATNEL